VLFIQASSFETPSGIASSCYTHVVNKKTIWRLLAAMVLTALLGVSIAPTGFTQNSTSSAKAIASLLEEHYHRSQTLRAVFLERYSEGPRQARIESGTVYFRRPGRMRWEYESPEKKFFIVDGKTAWFYVPYDHTVTKAPVKESSDWRTPLALLTGKAELSRLCSRIDLVSKGAMPAGHAILRCLPKGEAKPNSPAGRDALDRDTALPGTGDFTEVLLEVDTSTGELARIEIRQPGGIDLEYRFGDWQQDIALPDEMFQFRVPEGVAIVDGSALVNGSH
jgi:outer membrane lipoprotein carrier protein